MRDVLKELTKYKELQIERLESYGFLKNEQEYFYEVDLIPEELSLRIHVSFQKEIRVEVIDVTFQEPYVLHLSDHAVGEYVTMVRTKYEELLTHFVEHCFIERIYKSDVTIKLIEHVKERFGDDLEFLWKDYPDGAIWRRKDSKKWYGLLQVVSKRKLGMDSDEIVEIANFRLDYKNGELLSSFPNYYPAYHMNKKSWCSICLDGSVPLEDIFERLEKSYLLAKK